MVALEECTRRVGLPQLRRADAVYPRLKLRSEGGCKSRSGASLEDDALLGRIASNATVLGNDRSRHLRWAPDGKKETSHGTRASRTTGITSFDAGVGCPSRADGQPDPGVAPPRHRRRDVAQLDGPDSPGGGPAARGCRVGRDHDAI